MSPRQVLESNRHIDLAEWGRQRAQYSRARRGRNERGAGLAECSLVQGVTQALALRRGDGRPGAMLTAEPKAPTAA